MKLTIVKEIEDTDSIFFYIDNFITEKEIIKLKNILDYLYFVHNYNYSETKIIRYQK